jgi:hypothetical protein
MSGSVKWTCAIALVLIGCRFGELVGSPGGAGRLQFSTQPAATSAGESISPPVRVTVLDASGQPDTSYHGVVSLTLASNPSGAELLGNMSTTVENGVATFDNLRISQPGEGYMLRAEAPERAPVASARFNVVGRPAVDLEFVEQPTATEANLTITPPVRVAAVDEDGDVADYSGMITLRIDANPAGGALSGTLTVAAVGGVATFADLSIDRPGSGYRLEALAPGLDEGVSSVFSITGRATRLVFTMQPSRTDRNAPIQPAVRVVARDDQNRTVGSFEGPITVSLAPGSPGGMLSGTLTVNAVNGAATFPDLRVDRRGSGYRLVATAAGLAAATSNAFRIDESDDDDDDLLSFLIQPSTTHANTPISPPVQIAVVDSQGGIRTDYEGAITVDVAPNLLGGRVYGTLTVSVENGVAVFPDLRMDLIGVDYRLTAAFAGQNPTVQSAAFVVMP